MGLEEVMAHHPGEIEAERVLPRKRPIVEARDVLLLDAAKGKPTHGVGHDFQLSACASSFRGFVFLELDLSRLDNRFRELYAGAG